MVISPQGQRWQRGIDVRCEQRPLRAVIPVLLHYPLSAPLARRLRELAAAPDCPLAAAPVATWCTLTMPQLIALRDRMGLHTWSSPLWGLGATRLAELQAALQQLLRGQVPPPATVTARLAALQETAPRKLAITQAILAQGHSIAQTARRHGCSPTRARHILYQTCHRLNPEVFTWQMDLADLRAHRADFGF